ncbi:MAG: uridine kinase [Gammaproteobacteria bacterium]|uniref:uridine kinase n=1 Tax=unclassified Marinomonas TaxID=196814 RepID=UPI000C1E2FFE|nr:MULTISPECIES: uridine kinase [unclassified Marinomonas]MBU1294142.1 uridine kinase [Gammaproteobacteria bacterium]MBU1466462.1 uridine kinase [Gammaproteobacteria bacterium]MBU2023808.1 uridine kinase [Gammaproteobacteria bacterium]MBU2238408.1 uridine kinase [Gammaproteobacteria bacterium]MBU2318659.1 uridine kinase [Gammaproteobacteria bacterium]
MRTKVAPMFASFIFALSMGTATLVKAEASDVSRSSNVAELFGLPLNDLRVSQLENQLNSMGLHSYPSYKDGVISYSLGPEGILGVTNATIYSNGSGYVRQALLSGVVESSEKRKALGELLAQKYGKPSEGFLSNGIGRSKWLFKDGTMIEFHNTTYDVSLMYVDESPKVAIRSGQIDVEALSRKKQ